jgi:hypothetical protein
MSEKYEILENDGKESNDPASRYLKQFADPKLISRPSTQGRIELESPAQDPQPCLLSTSGFIMQLHHDIILAEWLFLQSSTNTTFALLKALPKQDYNCISNL